MDFAMLMRMAVEIVQGNVTPETRAYLASEEGAPLRRAVIRLGLLIAQPSQASESAGGEDERAADIAAT